jgi:hypothetical protein
MDKCVNNTVFLFVKITMILLGKHRLIAAYLDGLPPNGDRQARVSALRAAQAESARELSALYCAFKGFCRLD